MDIQTIQELTKHTAPYFFNDKTMRFFRQTMDKWKITKDGNRF